jgi:hypothetical protein
MEYYKNTLCISVGELTQGEPTSPDPREQPIMTYYACKHYINRNQHVRLRRACKNSPALLAYDKLRSDIKARIYFKIGDPYKATPKHAFEESIKGDPIALAFFRDHRYNGDRSLPEKAKAEYYANAIILNATRETLNSNKAFCAAHKGSLKNRWNRILDLINQVDRKAYPHTLPSDPRRLSDKFHLYQKHGYISLVHAAFGNKHTEKINDMGKMWLLSRWANQVDRCTCEEQLLLEYNEKASLEGWKQIKSTGPIHKYLFREDIQPLWHGYRFGELKSKEKFAMQISTELPSMRDSLWYSDGTKLNYYYLTSEGKVATCQVYEVMDAYSEVFLGYHISATEDYQAQYYAYKMAFKTSGHKPYQVEFDNQGGHKKLEAGEFFSKLAHLAIRTQPYNGKSKTIENAFSRFQQNHLKKDWFFTGQNITAKRNESKANLEFIMANKDKLPSLEEVKARYKQRRDEWHQGAHPSTGRPRLEMYFSSHNDKSPVVDAWDMVDMFWILRKDPVTCRAYGITFKEKKAQYDYLVYSAPRVPDQAWLRNNIDKKFWIKFDPDDMGIIYLYEKDASGLRFVTAAETKITVHRGIQEQEEGEAALIKQIIDENKRLREESKKTMDAILREHGQDAESYGLSTPGLKGISKHKTRKKAAVAIDPDKAISNMVLVSEDGEEDENYYKHY